VYVAAVYIGYVRIAFALISFYFMPTNHVIATSAYIFSSLLDAVDGYAARFLNQGILSPVALKWVVF